MKKMYRLELSGSNYGNVAYINSVNDLKQMTVASFAKEDAIQSFVFDNQHILIRGFSHDTALTGLMSKFVDSSSDLDGSSN